MKKVISVPTDENVAEITCRGVVLAILLTVLLALSNAYLALKLGILTSASIPAAIISMGILRFFKNATILENNAVQTAASAGEAIAGGIVYCIPALVIIHYWHHFDYFTNFFIAAAGGILGVLFSIPLRKILVNDPHLMFPEGRAIAEVLKTSSQKEGFRDIFLGSLAGGCLELLQSGFKIIASSWSHWFIVKRSLLGVGMGFSATMIGAGYLIGYQMAISIFLGALLSWGILTPFLSCFYPQDIIYHSPEAAMLFFWNTKMRYLGIGAMLFAGTWVFLMLIKPLVRNIFTSLNAFIKQSALNSLPRTDKDLPMPFILLGIAFMSVILFLFFQNMFPVSSIGLNENFLPSFIFAAVLYVLFIGFLFSVITAYFSGMVGVTASPGSSVIIAGMLFAAWILLKIITHLTSLPLSPQQTQAAEAITIIIGSVITGIAAIANDNTQDLKVGQLVGATPWKQQVMLLLGVIISALVIPPVMQLLFDVYGIAGVVPREGMDLTQTLPAPTAALMAAITEAVFKGNLPWNMVFAGAGIISFVLIFNRYAKHFSLSILGVGIGMYLPLTTSLPLFLGGILSRIIQWRLGKKDFSQHEAQLRQQKAILIACGLVAGSAIMDVFLAIPFSIFKNPDALMLVSQQWYPYSVMIALVSIFLLAFWMEKRVLKG